MPVRLPKLPPIPVVAVAPLAVGLAGPFAMQSPAAAQALAFAGAAAFTFGWVRSAPISYPRGPMIVGGLALVLMAGFAALVPNAAAAVAVDAVLGLAMVTSILVQLARRDGRAQVVAGLCQSAAAVTGVASAISLGLAAGAPLRPVTMCIGVAGVVAAAGTWILAGGGEERVRYVAGIGVGVMAGAAAVAILEGSAWSMTAASVGAGLVAAAVTQALVGKGVGDLSESNATRNNRWLLAAALPVLFAGPIALAALQLVPAV